VIKQLDADFGLPQLCLEKFWARRGVEPAVLITIVRMFQRRLGWLERVTAATCAFVCSHRRHYQPDGGRTTIRLSVPEPERGWWREVLTKLRCEFPNCNAVSQTPG